MTRLVRLRLRTFLVLLLITIMVGAVEEWLEVDEDQMAPLGDIARSAFLWGLGGAVFWGLETLVVPSRFGAPLRELPFVILILLKSIILTALFIAIFVFAQLVFEFDEEPNLMSLEAGKEFLLVLCVITGIEILVQSTKIVGGKTYWSFVAGRYRRPVQETKVFMFLDLAGSTALAQKMGDVGVQKMITRFFRDIDEPIAEHRGEVHRYIGDQVVVTWALNPDRPNLDPINCCFAIMAQMEALAPFYEKTFGIRPHFRMGLHAGPVVVSECGERRRQISYFGDTVNTAARVEQACKTFGQDLLISEDYAHQVHLEDGFTGVEVGRVQLRGRDRETRLLTIKRQTS